MTAFTDDHAEARKAKKKQGEAIRAKEFLKEKAVRGLYQTQEGRAYLRWLLEITGALGQNPFRSDMNVTAFLCGEQNIGQQIMAHLIRIDSSSFAELLKENENARPNQPAHTADQPDLFAEPEPNGADSAGPEQPAFYT